MVERALRLNIGCGVSYRPGMVNIDSSGGAVADKIADAADLPYPDNSVDFIEAYQLLEHFDFVHCKFLLSEWYRVLKPKGTLTIETPDFKQAAKKFLSSAYEKKISTVSWIYGIDSPGLQHKTGFDFDMAKSLLQEIGFAEVSRTAAKSHTYEPGMRITCSKPEGREPDQVLARFMKRVKAKLGIDDSFALVPLDGCLSELRARYRKIGSDSYEDLVKIVSRSAFCNPVVALSFLEELEALKQADHERIHGLRKAVEELSRLDLHYRLFTLWTNSKKGRNFDRDFEAFVERMAEEIRALLSDSKTMQHKLAYISSLQPTPIAALDRKLVLWEAERWHSAGLKAYCEGQFEEAIGKFERSLRMNASNVLGHWNLARLTRHEHREAAEIRRHYESAQAMASSRAVRERISKEMASLGGADAGVVSDVPVTQDDVSP
jgi:predicted SAM-dependent methyltransferase